MPAMSKPPTLERTSIASSGSGFSRASDWSMTSIFRFKPASDSPAPLPVSRRGSAPSRAHATALAVVVLPMPISPVAIIEYPFSCSSLTREAPVRIARSQSSRDMARVRKKLPVPRKTCTSRTPSTGRSMPISTGNTSAPATFAILHTVALPAAMFPATVAVTSLPVCVTPSATTPLSAQNVSTQRLTPTCASGMPSICATMSSNNPMPLSGLAMESHRL